MTDFAAAAISPAAVPPATHHPSAWHNGNSFSFRDLLDIVNPLQHIPVIGSLYRWATGDRPGEAAQIAGDALYGGPIGVGVGLLSAALEDKEGRDVAERLLVAAFGPGADGTATVAAATATPAQPTPQAASVAPTPAADPPKQLYGGIAQPPPSRAATAAAAADHAPISLYGGAAQPAAPAALAQVTNPGARALLARAIPLQNATPSVPHAGAGSNAPVPLDVPPGALPVGLVPTGRLAPRQSGQPLDISQKMMDGLEKYVRLQEERKKAAGTTDPSAGPSPGAPPSPAI